MHRFFVCFKPFANTCYSLFYSLLIINADVSLKLQSEALWTTADDIY